MIDAVWPGPRNAAICADWITMPLEASSRDIVLCDGGIHLLSHPHDHRKFVQTLHRLIAPNGLCIFRLFVPPAKREEPDDVLRDLFAKKIPNLNQLKLRLGTALQEDARQGVRLSLVWDTLQRAAPDFNRLAAQVGWPIEHLLAINTYRNSDNRYYFLSVAEVRYLFCEEPGGFEVQAIYEPTYELGERCPTIVLRRAHTKT